MSVASPITASASDDDDKSSTLLLPLLLLLLPRLLLKGMIMELTKNKNKKVDGCVFLSRASEEHLVN